MENKIGFGPIHEPQTIHLTPREKEPLMSPRFLFIAAIAFGAYVLGARAGRDRYESIKKSVTSFWDDPTVKKTRKGVARQTKKATRDIRR
ncbi:hypothetical protein IWX78_001540 [Mycetocola sp. CAN_C7]|uniref:hypothetical protein n=1 Tax=Mycetocola sp. CAN_C7 TaxID=2787724 RepID=UPI001A1AABF1